MPSGGILKLGMDALRSSTSGSCAFAAQAFGFLRQDQAPTVRVARVFDVTTIAQVAQPIDA